MTLSAIAVLLDPDAATVEKAQATNAQLREDSQMLICNSSSS